VRREIILSYVWGDSYIDSPALLHDSISRLRNRFKEAGAAKAPIQTLHGIGYRLDR
jgi:DNA-binding winged helix-turn-helix (wHTH) protein